MRTTENNVLATCIMMNFKFFQDYGTSDRRQESFKKMNEGIALYTDVLEFQKTLFKNELKVLKYLNYSLSCSDNALTTHIKSFLTMIDKTYEEYMAEQNLLSEVIQS
jgi:hypothetical protein